MNRVFGHNLAVRVSQVVAARNRDQIVKTASKLFRERGFDGVGVDEIMRAAGFSHGGFYGHFRSKEHLIDEACRMANAGNLEWTKKTLSRSKRPLSALVEAYLSPGVRDLVGGGCLMAALGTELGRRNGTARRLATQAILDYVDLISNAIKAPSKTEREEIAFFVYSAMIGALILSRATHDPKLSVRILRASRRSLRRL